MAAALQSFTSLGNPSPNPRCGIPRTTIASGLCPRSTSCAFRFEPRRFRSSAIVPGVPPCTRTSASGRCPQSLQLGLLDRRFPTHVAFAAPQEESMHDKMNGESGKDDIRIETSKPLEAWEKMLESFKEEAIKMQSVSQEAYDIYSKKALVVLKEASEKMKIQADEATRDLTKLAEVMSEEGKEYLSVAAKNSPESIKDIVETFASSPHEVKDISEVRDFHLGIPYGGFLAVEGFLHFMLTGSVSAIRFGVILGSILLALSVLSLRAWRSGQPSNVFLKGQAAITAIIFIREWNLLCRRLSFSSLFAAFISGAMLVFYIYRMFVDGRRKGPNLEQTPEK